MPYKVTPNALSITTCIAIMLIPFALYSQQVTDTLHHERKKEHHSLGFGIKAGFNFSNVTKASSINANSRTGFHVGLLLAPSSGIIGSRTELIYSRHGYNYTNDTTSGSVNLDYIMLAQLMAIHITKYFEIQLGGQTAYLLHAKADSSTAQLSTLSPGTDKLLSYYNRLDYGFALGAEVHPVAGLLIGARYNISLSNLYKTPTFTPGSGQTPSFAPPSIDLKNNVVQLYLGYRF